MILVSRDDAVGLEEDSFIIKGIIMEKNPLGASTAPTPLPALTLTTGASSFSPVELKNGR